MQCQGLSSDVGEEWCIAIHATSWFAGWLVLIRWTSFWRSNFRIFEVVGLLLWCGANLVVAKTFGIHRNFMCRMSILWLWSKSPLLLICRFTKDHTLLINLNTISTFWLTLDHVLGCDSCEVVDTMVVAVVAKMVGRGSILWPVADAVVAAES